MTNRKRRGVSLFFLSIFLLSGCATFYKTIEISTRKDEQSFEKSRTFETDFDTLWSDLIQTINAGGKKIMSVSKERDHGSIVISETLSPQRLNEIAIVPSGINWRYLSAFTTLEIKAKNEYSNEVTVKTQISGDGRRSWEVPLSYLPLVGLLFFHYVDVKMGSKGVMEKEYLDTVSSLVLDTKDYAWLEKESRPEELIKQLKDKDAQRRRLAVFRLGKIANPQTLKALIDSLKDEDVRVRKEAVQALSKIGKPALEPVLNCLNSSELYLRANAALVLGNIGSPSAVTHLISLLKDKAPLVRKNAASALGKIRDSRAVESLISTLNDEDLKVRIESAYALGEIKDINALKPLVSLLEDKDLSVRQEVIFTLSKFGEPALEPIISCLEDKDSQMRNSAVRALGKLKYSRSVEALIEFMKNEGKSISKEDKGIIVSPEGAVSMVNAGADNRRVIWNAAYALAHIGELAVEPLIDCLNDEEIEIQCATARALGETKDKRAIEPLINYLRKKPKIKGYFYCDPHYEVKEALRKITGQDFGSNYSSWLRWWNEQKKGD